MFARVWLLAAVAFVALVGVTDAGYHGWVVQNTFRTRRLYTLCQTCRIFSCPSGYHWSHYSGCSFWSASCHYHCNRDECRPGYYGSTGGHLNLSCYQCGSGKYSGQGKSSCSTCAAGKYSNGARTGCSNCPGGKTSSAGSGSCTWNTKNPTKSPTKNPTKAPTKSPTKNPTKSPTKNPTKAPTKQPTTGLEGLAQLTGDQLSGLTGGPDSGGLIPVDPEVQILVDKWTTSVRGELKSKGSSKAKKKKMFKKEKKFRNKKGKDTLKLDMKEYFTPGMTKRARNKLRKVMLSIARAEMRAEVPAEMGSDFEEPPMSFGLDEAGLGASFKARAEASGALEVLVTFAPAKTESQTAPGATQCEEADVDLVDTTAPVDVVCAAVGDVALVCHGALPVTRMTLTGEGNSQSGVDEYHVKCWSGAGWDAGSFVETEDTYTCGGRTFYVQSLGVAPDDGSEATGTTDTTQVAVVGDSMYVCGSLFAGRCKVWNLSDPGSLADTAQPAGATFGAVPTAALAMGAATITFSDSSIAVTTGAGADREDHEFPFACACA